MKNELDKQAIRELAYSLWLERGGSDDHADQDWLEAERRLSGSQSVATPAQLANAMDQSRDVTPAGSPPDSTIIDVPPPVPKVSRPTPMKVSEPRLAPARNASQR